MAPGDDLSIRSPKGVIGGKFLYYNSNNKPLVQHILVDKSKSVL